MTKRQLSRLLTTDKEMVCLDQTSYLTALALAVELTAKGKTVGKIKKGY